MVLRLCLSVKLLVTIKWQGTFAYEHDSYSLVGTRSFRVRSIEPKYIPISFLGSSCFTVGTRLKIFAEISIYAACKIIHNIMYHSLRLWRYSASSSMQSWGNVGFFVFFGCCCCLLFVCLLFLTFFSSSRQVHVIPLPIFGEVCKERGWWRHSVFWEWGQRRFVP